MPSKNHTAKQLVQRAAGTATSPFPGQTPGSANPSPVGPAAQSTEASSTHAPGTPSPLQAALMGGPQRQQPQLRGQAAAALLPVYIRGNFQQMVATQAANHLVRTLAEGSTTGASSDFNPTFMPSPPDLNPYVFAEYEVKLTRLVQGFVQANGRHPVIDGDCLTADDLAFRNAMNQLAHDTWGADAPNEVQGGATTLGRKVLA